MSGSVSPDYSDGKDDMYEFQDYPPPPEVCEKGREEKRIDVMGRREEREYEEGDTRPPHLTLPHPSLTHPSSSHTLPHREIKEGRRGEWRKE